jgi:hypothetical protein
MGATVAEYDAAPCLTVDWDLEMLAIEQRIERERRRQEQQQ